MAITISTVLVFGIILFLLIRRGGMNPWHALVAVLFGFFLAGSSVAPSINDGATGVAGFLASLNI
ncbi:hypothetical protein [Allostreptomyces psammosilenae]|uniref:H+/gluconate symporter-like permease n=1 Tax=Allostreptomyces psammosilenae TaxID=1892865 RepID=A0A853A375_9ACTN|nr:hypothetical protein [Allostreptomyces psammosilenae]NYI04928.1 H+/gluconate symporter-like permease [Allostreptomyces psammosilenae]